MKNQGDLSLLVSTNDLYIINQVKAVLKDNNIPFIEKDSDSGSYMKIIGMKSFYQTDLYVSVEDFSSAQELINFLEED